MRREWQCRKCGANIYPDREDYSPVKCPSCKTPRWPWKAAVLVLALGIVAIAIVWASWPDPEAKFLETVHKALQGQGESEGVITPEENEKLNRLSQRLGIPDRAEALILKARQDLISARKEQFKKNLPGEGEITSEELQQLCALAGRMEMIEAIPECSVVVAGVSGDEIKQMLCQGELTRACNAVRKMQYGPEKERLLIELETPLQVEVKLQYQIGHESPSQPLPLDAPELQNLALTHNDNYRFQVSTARDNVYFYLFQKDHYGQMIRIFPDPVWSGEGNPIRSGNVYSIPLGDKEWLYLDELPASAPGPITETFHIVASPWRAQDLEAIYGRIHEATEKEVRQKLMEDFLSRVRQRTMSEVKAVHYKEFNLSHAR